MYRIISTIFLLCLSGFNSQGQSLLININAASCPTCSRGLSFLFASQLQYPVTALFPEDDRVNSEEIESMYSYAKHGVNVIFSDKLVKKYFADNKTAQILFVDEFQNARQRIEVNAINCGFIAKVNSYKNSCRWQYFHLSFDQDGIFVHNYQFKYLKKLDKSTHKELYKLKSSVHNGSMLFKLVNQSEGEGFQTFLVNKNFNNDRLQPHYSGFTMGLDGYVYALFEYVNGDRKKNGTKMDTLLYEDVAVIKYGRNGVFQKAMTIESHQENGYDLFARDLLVKNEEEMYGIVHRPDKWFYQILAADPTADIKYIAKYNKKNARHLKYSKHLDFTLPKFFKHKYHDKMLGMEMSEYPYVILPFANEVMNVANGEQVEIMSSALFNQFFKNKSPDIKKENFKIIRLYRDAQKKEVYVFWQAMNKYYMNTYNEQLKMLRVKRLPNMPGMKHHSLLFYDRFSQLLYYYNTAHEGYTAFAFSTTS